MTDLALWAQTNPHPASDGRSPSVDDHCDRCKHRLGPDYVLGDPQSNRWVHHTCRLVGEEEAVK